MLGKNFSPTTCMNSAVSALIPAFLLLSLNGTAAFYGFEAVAAIACAVGVITFLASAATRKRAQTIE